MRSKFLLLSLLFISPITLASCSGNDTQLQQPIKIRFCDENGNLIKAYMVQPGSTINHQYTKPSTPTMKYTFLGWSETIDGPIVQIPPVTEPKTYYAIIKSEPITPLKFRITFCDDEGNLLETKLYEEGTRPSCDMTKPDSDTQSYTLVGWSATLGGPVLDILPLVISDATYYGVFEAHSLKRAKVIVLSGQSNMEGHDAPFSALPADKKSSYVTGTDNVKIYYDCLFTGNNSNGKFVDVNFGQGRTKDLFGPEVGLAKWLAVNDPDHEYYLVKSAKGSAYLDPAYSDNEFSYAAVGTPYKQLENDVTSAINVLKSSNIQFELSAFVWMQGEADAGNSLYTSHYQANEKALIERFENKFSSYVADGGLIFVDSGISTLGWPTVENAKKINQAKQNICNSNTLYTYCEESETLPKINSFHYTAESYLTLGEKYAENYLKVESAKVKKTSTIPTAMNVQSDEYIYYDSNFETKIVPEFVGGSEPYHIELKNNADYVGIDEKGKLTILKKPPQNINSNSGRACELYVNCYVMSKHFAKEVKLHVLGDPVSYFSGSVDFYQDDLRNKSITNGKTIWFGDSFFDSRSFWDVFYTNVGPSGSHFNAGISGSSIESWMGIVDTLIYPNSPANIVINLGTNDFWDLRRDDKTVFASFTKLISAIHTKLPNTNIYYYSVINRNGAMPNKSMNQTILALNTYNQNVANFANSNSYLHFINTFNHFCNPDGTLIYNKTKDGIHPANEEYSYLVNCAKEAGLNVTHK